MYILKLVVSKSVRTARKFLILLIVKGRAHNFNILRSFKIKEKVCLNCFSIAVCNREQIRTDSRLLVDGKVNVA